MRAVPCSLAARILLPAGAMREEGWRTDMDKKLRNLICDIEEELNRMKRQELPVYRKGMEENRDAGFDSGIGCGGSNDHSRGSFEE